MATLRQKKVAKELVENLNSPTPKTKKEILVSSGYTQVTAESSAKIILEGEGVKQELKEVYGFDEETAKNVVADILIGAEDDGHRLKAADMIFKVQGTYAPEKHQNLNVNVDSNIQELADKAAELLRERKL